MTARQPDRGYLPAFPLAGKVLRIQRVEPDCVRLRQDRRDYIVEVIALDGAVTQLHRFRRRPR